MRLLAVTVAIVSSGCLHSRAGASTAFHPTGPVTLAVVPFPSPAEDDAFSSAFVDPGRVSLLPIDGVRAQAADDRHLRRVLADLADSRVRTGDGLQDLIGDDDLTQLRTRLAPAELLLVAYKFEVLQRLWHSMTVDISYRIYDLQGGKLVAEDKKSLKMDTDESLGMTETDTRAEDKMLTSVGKAVRSEVDAMLGR
jgi:hypothetical protein